MSYSAKIALLGGVIDYAGTFPPAALPFPEAIKTVNSFRARATHPWLVGRLALPVSLIKQLDARVLFESGGNGSPWLIAALGNPDKKIVLTAKTVHPLIGLGPGLTPSGDDYFGGMMIALHAVGETRICRQLWKLVYPGAKDTSNPISCAHLKAASHGEGSETIHRALSAVLKGCPQGIQNCLSGIDHIGHTSGWDIMAGVVIALEGIVRANQLEPGCGIA